MTVKNGKPTTSAPIQFCAAAVSVMAFIVAASPLGTIGKPGADFSTPGGGEEVHWFKWSASQLDRLACRCSRSHAEEKSNLSLQGWSTERLMFTGGLVQLIQLPTLPYGSAGAMTVIAEAGFFAMRVSRPRRYGWTERTRSTAWAGAPSYWSIQSGGGFSVKKLPHDS